jgi:hypothetical protein
VQRQKRGANRDDGLRKKGRSDGIRNIGKEREGISDG